MRLGVIGDIAEATGFGRVTRELGKRWIEAGIDCRFLGINYRGADGEVQANIEAGGNSETVHAILRTIETDPVLMNAVPAGLNGDPLGNNMTAGFLAGQYTPGWQADAALVVGDPRAMLERLVTDRGVLRQIPVWNYVPIEGTRLTPYWRAIWNIVKPVAMSDFGGRELGALLGRNDVPVIKHGISDAFHPVSEERPGYTSKGEAVTSREQARALLGWTDRTVIFRADRNVPRKDYPAFFDAIRPIIADHPEVLVVIHCAPIDEGGILSELIADLPGAYDSGQGWKHSQVHQTKAHDTWKGLTDRQLNLVYNAADIYASPTWAEGFGLTLAEAAATGLPVVTTDFAAGPEVAGPGAVLVPPRWLQGNPAAHRWSVVDTGRFTEALEQLVCDPAERRRLGALGIDHVRRFSWDEAAVQFIRLFESV